MLRLPWFGQCTDVTLYRRPDWWWVSIEAAFSWKAERGKFCNCWVKSSPVTENYFFAQTSRTKVIQTYGLWDLCVEKQPSHHNPDGQHWLAIITFLIKSQYGAGSGLTIMRYFNSCVSEHSTAKKKGDASLPTAVGQRSLWMLRTEMGSWLDFECNVENEPVDFLQWKIKSQEIKKKSPTKHLLLVRSHCTVPLK